MSDDADDSRMFQEAVKGTRPLKFTLRVQQTAPPPAPIPRLHTMEMEEATPASPARAPGSPFLDLQDEDVRLGLDTNMDDRQLFRLATQGTRPLQSVPRVVHSGRKPRPIPQQFLRDEMQALADSLSDHYIPAHELESGEELLYLRDGHSPDILRKLRRGHWVIQGQLDLHGLTAEEARLYMVEFLAHCRKRGARCVRIIHGKGLGSKNREPVLKHKLRSWLMQRDEVIAYAQARQVDGGAGAVVVLLKAG